MYSCSQLLSNSFFVHAAFCSLLDYKINTINVYETYYEWETKELQNMFPRNTPGLNLPLCLKIGILLQSLIMKYCTSPEDKLFVTHEIKVINNKIQLICILFLKHMKAYICMIYP